MIKLLYIIFISLIVTNCSTKKVEKHHGVPFLEKKNKIAIFLENLDKIEYLVDYFDDFVDDLSKKNLNYFLKGVSNH